MHFKLKLHPQATSPGSAYPGPSAGSYWHLHRALGSRCLASTSTSSTSPHIQFPFPTHRNPTPHQIFHLPPGASQTEIKARCTPYFPSSFPKTHAIRVQITNLRGLFIQIRLPVRPSPRACARRVFTPSLEPTTSFVGNLVRTFTMEAPQMIRTLQSSPAADVSTRGVRPIGIAGRQNLQTLETWMAQMRRGKTKLSSLSDLPCAPPHPSPHRLSSLSVFLSSRLWWALHPPCCRCPRSLMRGIALRPPTLLKHALKLGRLETSAAPQFVRVSQNSNETRGAKSLHRSMSQPSPPGKHNIDILLDMYSRLFFFFFLLWRLSDSE
jgi:hypothetical protein